jgi:hypothetical protein
MARERYASSPPEANEILGMIDPMPACPWCKAPVGDLLVPCPRCGKTANDAGGPVLGLDVPDLDIPARPSKASAAAKPAVHARPAPAAPARSPEPQKQGVNDPGARTFEEDDGDLAGGSLDLDLSNGPPLVASVPPPKAPAPVAPQASPSPPGKGGGPSTSVPPEKPAAAPSSKDSRERRVEIDPFEARALADYGEAPEALWKTPFYAYRVLRRRPELKKLSEQKAREAQRAQGAAEDALLSFAEVVRSDAEKLAGYAAAFEAVRATEEVLGQRDAVLAAENDAHKHRQAEFNAKLAELEATLTQIQLEERQVAGELAEADALLKRAEARAKRVELEMKNAIAQAEQGGAVGESAPPPKGPGL